MTNAEKYKTAAERAEAWEALCTQQEAGCRRCPLGNNPVSCKFVWLEQEADIDPCVPCPFCGGNDIRTLARIYPITSSNHSKYSWDTVCRSCGATVLGTSKADAIAKWNRRAK